MYLVLGDRTQLISQLPQNLNFAEIGVYRGDFSEFILKKLHPHSLTLIDSWHFEPKAYKALKEDSLKSPSFGGKIHWQHFGDDAAKTQENNFNFVKSRFLHEPRVKIIRANSIEGIAQLLPQSLDVAYVDASHEYEDVLSDLLAVESKITDDGVIVMNDFYEGPGGEEQNLGVMAAANTFAKRKDFFFIAMSHGPYCDCILARNPNGTLVTQFLENLNNSDLTLIGISDALVPNMRYQAVGRKKSDRRILLMF